MERNFKILLSFDLDFTLIDNKEGIVNSFKYALKKHGIPDVKSSIIKKMIGTPLDDMFAEISDMKPSLLSSAFREYYGTQGIFQVKILPGVLEMLREMKEQGFRLGVITSKKEEMAVKLVKHLKIDKYFNYVIGESEKIKSKSDPNLKALITEKYHDYQLVVIGDHPKDMQLADDLSCPFVGVLTGSHSAEQLSSRSKSKIKTLILKSVEELTPDKIYSLF